MHSKNAYWICLIGFCSSFLILLGVLIFAYLPALLLRHVQNDSFDGFLFSQQWPITTCLDHESEEHGSGCNLYPNVTSWTVHGLWPTKVGTRGPNFCNSTWKFSREQVKSIEPYLIKYWPNLYSDEGETSLWKHEWSKHGTCAAHLIRFNSEFKYFSTGLELAETYDYVSYLAAFKIYPNDDVPYNLQDIYNSVKYFVKTEPIIDCTYNKAKKRNELYQLKICFNNDLQLIDCDKLKYNDNEKNIENVEGLEKIAGDCPDKGVFYPSSAVSKGFSYRYTSDLAVSHMEHFMESAAKCSTMCNIMKLLRTLMY